MAERRTRGMTGQTRTTAARAAAIAEQLHQECVLLLELFERGSGLEFNNFIHNFLEDAPSTRLFSWCPSCLRQSASRVITLTRQGFPVDLIVDDSRLVSVPLPSSQPESRDKLWCLHSALLQCRSLLERAISREEEELGGGEKGEYEDQRKTVRERLSLLLASTGDLLKTADGTAVVTPHPEAVEVDSPAALFELKMWIYRIFKELHQWTSTAIATLQALPSVTAAKDRGRVGRVRKKRGARR